MHIELYLVYGNPAGKGHTPRGCCLEARAIMIAGSRRAESKILPVAQRRSTLCAKNSPTAAAAAGCCGGKAVPAVL